MGIVNLVIFMKKIMMINGDFYDYNKVSKIDHVKRNGYVTLG